MPCSKSSAAVGPCAARRARLLSWTGPALAASSVALAALGLPWLASPAAALPPVSTALTTFVVTATPGEKPQSKVWTYAGRWWCVMPNSAGTWVWRLDGTTWTNVLNLSASTSVHADVKATGAVSHVLLFDGASSQLASIEYVPVTQTYQAWATRPANVALALDTGVETATIDLDSQGRMWLTSQYKPGSGNEVRVRYSDSPYSTWLGPVTLATGINSDDISVVTAMPGGKIGVLWSNQNTQRFGFRTHVDGADPAVWTADELPASQSALNVGLGMADDHMHVAMGSDGTLYAAVKTSYDTGGYPKMALLVRRPAGTWDNLYEVDGAGTRAIVLLDESAGKVAVVYTTTEGSGNIIYKESPTSAIAFGTSNLLMNGGLNDVTSIKRNLPGSVVIMAGLGTSASSVLLTNSGGSTGPTGWWKMNGDLTDASGAGNDATASGGPAYVAGSDGQALNLNGTSQFAYVPNNATLGITNAFTLATWVKPSVVATQNLLSRSVNGSVNGYELCLASAGSPSGPNKAFLRINQQTGGDTYRVNSNTPYSGLLNTWFHLAGTYDGTTLKIYVNGVLDNSLSPPSPPTIATNTLPLGIGAEVNASNAGTRWFLGAMDDARLYDRALSAAEIAALAGTTPPPDITPPNPVTNLSAPPAASGNDASGLTRIAPTWSGAEAGATVKVYRKGYGDYPVYGTLAEPASPATPAAADAAGWSLTSVQVSGETDQPPTRDYWYYVLFLTDGSGNTSAVSNRTGGTLGYLLGDVANGTADCTGNNVVNTGDVSLLGTHYGEASGYPGYLACLDVAPTADHSPTARPTPDGAVEFEDLVMFALNYTGPGGPGPVTARPAQPVARAAEANALELQVPALPGVGETFVVTVRASGRGDVQALSLELGYDRSVVEMAGVESGELLGRQTAQAVVLTPRAGRVDIALLGRGAGLAGEGELVRVRFRVQTAGAAALTLKGVEARDGGNRKLALGGTPGPVVPRVPAVTQLRHAQPNPFGQTVSIGFSVAERGPVELALYAVDGRRVRTLAHGVREPGEYTLVWNGRNDRGESAPVGIYFVRLVTVHGHFTRTVTYLR